MGTRLDYLDHLHRESARFLEAVRHAGASTAVPTCPDWDADDLLWHLAEVQWFWATVVRDGVDGEQADADKPPRPSDRAGLETFFVRASADLSDALSDGPDDAPTWTWSSEQTVGFVRRRQAHEALIHRVDAELTAGERTPMDPSLSADGVDEALRVMYGALPPWGAFTPDRGSPVRLVATDTGHSWLVSLGQFTGTDPEGGISYDEPDLHPAVVDGGEPAAATLRGTAADLDCWMWRRPTVGVVEGDGDRSVLDRLEATIANGIN
jgi:uncharacterized protein (TIGR03083 family)